MVPKFYCSVWTRAEFNKLWNFTGFPVIRGIVTYQYLHKLSRGLCWWIGESAWGSLCCWYGLVIYCTTKSTFVIILPAFKLYSPLWAINSGYMSSLTLSLRADLRKYTRQVLWPVIVTSGSLVRHGYICRNWPKNSSTLVFYTMGICRSLVVEHFFCFPDMDFGDVCKQEDKAG